MPHLLDKDLVQTLVLDRERLATTEIPIVTVAGTSREEIKDFYGLGVPDAHLLPDVVLSRAHFSMPLGVLVEIWKNGVHPEKAWMADPTNYVNSADWRKVEFTEFVAKELARRPLLKHLKDLIDRFGRDKLPILSSITPPLLYLTEKVHRPILSFHIAAGNILAEHGKEVVQVITDPHVRLDYLTNAYRENIRFCVFDERTKTEFLETAATHHIETNAARVIVTGPPIDPRIVHARHHKVAWRSGPLHLCITTGGLGTNKDEIRRVLQQLLPQLHHQSDLYRVLMYAGTQKDIADMVKELAHEHHIKIDKLQNPEAHLRLIYSPELLEANEALIKYGFPWAHGFITKPSGDMAYDAVAAGCFLLTLQEWGVWEERIREVFEQKDIARRADVDQILEQLTVLRTATKGASWIERAMNHAFGIEKLFLLGSKKIVEAVQSAT